MNKSKNELRDELFNKYFENEEGVLLSDLVQILSPVTEKGKELRTILFENVKGFHPFSSIYQMKNIEQNDNSYLIIRCGAFFYLVIDLDKREVLDKETVKSIFNEDFFISNFAQVQEEKEYIKNNGLDTLCYLSCKGDISKVIDFYCLNKELFDNQERINYRLNVEEAVTQLTIDLINDSIQLNFDTPNQFLYEQVFFKGNLTPASLQDAYDKMGRERMLEIIDRVKDIRIPSGLVPAVVFDSEPMPKTISSKNDKKQNIKTTNCLLYTSPSPRD